MCFLINARAERPTQTTVWKILAQLPDGRLVAPVANAKINYAKKQKSGIFAVLTPWYRLAGTLVPGDLEYRLGEVKEASSGPVMHISMAGMRSASGLYVFLSYEQTLSTAKGMLSSMLDDEQYHDMVIVECVVASEDWRCSSAVNSGYGEGVATYGKLVPRRIVSTFKFDLISEQYRQEVK